MGAILGTEAAGDDWNAGLGLVRMKLQYPDFSLAPIVIVDDCDDDVFLLRHRLRAGDITNPIVSFRTTASALMYLDSAADNGTRPQVVFTDVRMPGECGFDLIGKIREDARWDDVKIVVVSYSNHPQDLQRALRLRADGYLIKFPPPELLAEFVRQGPWFAVPRTLEASRHALSA
jgi:CheY-like chemotaxis protein